MPGAEGNFFLSLVFLERSKQGIRIIQPLWKNINSEKTGNLMPKENGCED